MSTGMTSGGHLRMTRTTTARWGTHVMIAFAAAAAAVSTAQIDGLTPAAQAEKIWDIGAFDSCMKKAGDRYASGETVAPPATFQTQPAKPGDVAAPRPRTATLL
jgi:hypothetical protein